MNEIVQVLLLALLPGIGNFAGGLIAELSEPSAKLLNWALHAASGIVIAIVSIELLSEALGVLAGWWIAMTFAAGGAVYVLLERGIARLQAGNGQDNTRMWMIYAAVGIDLASDGLMIGAGSAVSFGLALVLASGQILADIPEGYATVANFRDKKLSRSRRLALSISFTLFPLTAAVAGYLFLRDAGEAVQMGALVFVAGLLTVAAVEDMLKEAHESREDTSGSVLAFVFGFALFTLVSAGLEAIISGQGNSLQS